MEKRILFTHPETGSLAVIVPVDKNLTIDEIAAKNVPENVPYRICDVTEIPEDRTFREAWKDNGKVEIDMPKARDIHMDRIRADRDKALAKLDTEQMKGRDVATEKQALRDLPDTFDLTTAATPDELKALWPAELGA